MSDGKDFNSKIKDVNVPLLTLDQKWHQLFQLTGKPKEVTSLEDQITKHLARQAHINDEMKDLKKLKSTLMSNIVLNMEGTTEENTDEVLVKKLEEDRRLIDEINLKLEDMEDELLEIPRLMKQANDKLMVETMNYCYSQMRDNVEQIHEIAEWIEQVRIDLKKNIIIKQNREIMNKQMYSYMHDIFGADVIDIFDLKYENANEEDENNS